MKIKISEPDFIGGQGTLTKEEELMLSQYFARKKAKEKKAVKHPSTKSKSSNKVHA